MTCLVMQKCGRLLLAELLIAALPDEELGGMVPLTAALDEMRQWIETRLQKELLWRSQPEDWVDKCRCNKFAWGIHRAGFCNAKMSASHVMWFPFVHVMNLYYEAVEKMQQQQREVVQALQEKRGGRVRLLLADTADRASRFGLSHAMAKDGQNGGNAGRISNFLNTDADCHEYIRWLCKTGTLALDAMLLS